jgi:hypothetical protein
MVETKPSAVSTLLDERSVNDFPLNGRRFSDLALFSPGVTQDPRGLTSATSGDLSFGGIRGVRTTPFSLMAVITTTPSSRRRAAAIERHISFPPRSWRSFACPRMPTAQSKDDPAEPWSMW